MANKKIHIGDLIVSKNMEIDFEEITGFLKIEVNVKFVGKKLKTVGGSLDIYSEATLPKLETVGGYLDINSGATLEAPKLETVGGYLDINSGATLEAPKLETVGGYLDINSGATLEAPKLETVGGSLDIYSEATLPKLETVGGYLDINSGATLPKLETVGGDLSIYSEVTLEAPKLINKNDRTAKTTCDAALALSFKKKGFIKIDGILSWIFSQKKIKDLFVFKVKIVGKLNFSFVVQRNDQFSHGETVAKAIESLRYKLTDRDTSRFKGWKLTTKISVEDAIQAYRAITGACEFGVKSFCESIEIPKKLVVSDVIRLTQGKYGNEVFEKFFR